jgi:predicted dehydrogenase|tara:strand:- start:3130 stop:4086 length:957 start_codon:yes stop_codon:yes gene_type:complete
LSWKVLLVGLGNVSFKYDLEEPEDIVQTHARAFGLHKEFEVVGGVDPSDENKEQFQRVYGIRTFKTITCAFEHIKADVVVIASPTLCHLDNLHEVLSCCKPRVILMEKPAVYTKEQAQKMVDMSSESTIPILINLVRRADPSVMEIMKRINSGVIKLPCKGVVWYSKGLIHNACHFIDLLSLWLGTPKKIEVLDAGRKINDFDWEPDLRIQFSNSIVYFVAKNIEELSYYNIELLATNGKLNFGSGDNLISWQAKSKINSGLEPNLHKIKNELYQYQLNVVNDIECFLNNQPVLLPTLEAHVENMNLVYEITNTNRME